MKEQNGKNNDNGQSYIATETLTNGASDFFHNDHLFKLMVESAVEYAIFAVNANGLIVNWNAGAERIFGYNEREIAGKDLSVLFTEEDRAADVPLEEIKKARENGSASDDRWLQKADGSRFWANGKLMALKDDAGSFRGFVKIVRDQTERQQAAREVANSSNLRFQEMIRQSPLSTFVSDASGQIKYVNPAFTRLWGLAVKDLANYNALADEQAESLGIKPYIERAFAGETVEFPPVCYDPQKTSAVRGGNKCWIKTFAYPIKDEAGNIVEVVTMHEDVSEKMKSEAELAASKQSLELALKAGKAGIFEWNIKEDYNVWSSELEKLYGVAPGTFEGNFDSWYKRLVKEDADRVVAGIKENLARGSEEYAYEFRVVLPDGTHRWLAGRAHFLYDAESNPEKMIGINFDITERKRTEEELERSREYYEALVLASSQIVWTTNAAGKVNVDSPSWRAFTGQTYEEWLNQGWNAIHPDDRERSQRAWVKAIEDGTNYEVEYRVRHKSGEYRWTAVRGVPLRNEDGTIREWVGMNTDINEQKQGEDALRASEEFSRSIIASSPDCFKILDTEGRLQFMNDDGFCLMEIDDFEQFKGQIWADFWQGEEHNLASEAVEKARRGEIGKFQGFCRTAKGTPKWWDVVVSPVRGARGEIVRLLSISRDITANKRTEQEREDLRQREINALKQSEIERQKLESLFKQSPAIINIMRGPDHVFDLIHPRMPELLGERDYLNKPIREILPEPDYEPFIELMNRVYQTGETYCGNDTPIWLNTPEGGREGYFDFIYQAWHEVTGEIGGVMSLGVEVTDRVLARQAMERAAAERESMLEREQQLRKTAEDASRLKDEFLATVSHELRTPLNAIIGWSQMMRSGVVKADQYEKAIETIDRNARSQAQLIDDLLDITRIVTGKLRLNLEETNFASVINSAVQTVRPAAQAKNIQLFVNMSSEQADILGDAERLQQVVWNLLSNAVKFTPKSGEIFVTLEMKGSHLKLSVRDTGEGIGPEFLPFVFDRFSQADMSSTRRMGGLGLGLSIVRHLVEMHGGSVGVSSEGKNRGTIFTVILPVNIDRQEEQFETARATHYPDSAGNAPTARLDGIKVLVVDDEPDACEVLKILLEQCGAHVSTANSASEAIEKMSEELPNVLVSDIAMPEEDGYSLIKKIRNLPKEKGGDIAAIALTAYASQTDRKKALEAGFQSHITKPVDQNALVTILASLV